MDLTMHLVVFLSVIFAVILEPSGISAAPKNNDAPLSYRHLFQRDSGRRLSARPARQYHESTIEACASACVMETSFLCKSFDLDNTLRSCELFSVSLDDPDVQLIAADDIDHYRTTYEKQFIRLPHHKLTDRHDLRQVDISVEGCARLCMLETQFKCQGFDYDVIRRHCWLSQMTSENIGGATPREQWDYYSRAPVGVLSKFMNYGNGQLKLLQSNVYDASVMGVSLNNCADSCLGQTNFRCVSFDYTYNGPDQSLCKMSKHLAANVYGLVRNHGHRTLHYERIEPSMMNFYSTPYTLLRTSPEKMYALVTPSLCAQRCLKEEAFVCRSFNYITESGTCQLSTKTGSDVGGLFTQSNRQIHHFELKPILDCGGNFTDNEGNFASPNWPRNYAHNEDCSWHITVPAYKVVKFYFTYLELAVDPHEPCNENSDRVIITEHTLTTSRSFCVTPGMKTFIARSNNVTVTFKSNTYTDGQGFRVFYNAEWTCDVHLHSSSGQIASTGFPAHYKSSTTCSWRITAPHNYRVIVNFSHFELEQNVLGHCNERHDRVILLDGGTVSSPLIGLYCGVHTEEFSVKSSGMDIFIQFQSDEDTEAQGFHAYYEFESQNGTLYKALPGEIQGPGGVVPLDAATGEDIIEHTYGENGMLVASAKKHMQTDELSPHINRLGIGYRSISGGASRSPVNHAYRTTMWAVLSVLLLLLVSALIVIVLVWRHFKRQLHKLTSQTQNHEELPAEEVPLQDTRFHKQCNNEVALPAIHKPSPVCGATVDTSSATARYTNSPLFTDTTVDKDNRINEKNVNNIKT